MAVTIDDANIGSINEGYPVAGQDNDSQGFRDNFNAIKTALGEASDDITTLDNNTAKLNVDNVFYNTENDEPVNIEQANFKQVTEQLKQGDSAITSTGTVSINFSDGHYHVLTLDTPNVTFDPTAWPSSGRLARITVQLSVKVGSEYSACQVSFTSLGGSLKLEPGFSNPITVSSEVNPKIFEFWTYNGGNIVYGRYLGEYS